MPEIITPATLILRNGVAYSETFCDTYWSLAGGAGETRHVFLSGNDLPARWSDVPCFTILETGFGTGLNFLCTWQLWRDTAPQGARLQYIAVDKHPFHPDDLAKIYQLRSEFTSLEAARGAQLLANYPPLAAGSHTLQLDDGRVNLNLLWGDAALMLEQLTAVVNAFFLDGFAPSRNPDMWSPALFAQLARLAAPKATCASYTVAGRVRRGLSAAGFSIAKQPGFGTKREMLVGRRN